MGQKVSPIGFRTGIRLGWKSRWFAPKSNFGEFLVEDQKVRDYIDRKLNRQPPYAAISSIEVERTREEVKVTLRTARPGLVIGPRGAEVDKLREELEELTNRRVNVNILEIGKPDLDAQLAAEGISEQLKRRTSFRRAIKQRGDAIMQAGAKGVKIEIAGRLGGAEMSRRVKHIDGSIPLHTLDADVDYGFTPCFTTYGTLGVKVWIYRGMYGESVSPDEAREAPSGRPSRGRRGERGRGERTRGERGRGGRGPRSARPRGRRGPAPARAAQPEAAGPEPESKAPAPPAPAPEPEPPKQEGPESPPEA